MSVILGDHLKDPAAADGDRNCAANAVTKTITAADVLTLSNFILVRISLREKQQTTAPAAMVRNKLMSALGPAAKQAKTQ
jgi:hypothetical protein